MKNAIVKADEMGQKLKILERPFQERTTGLVFQREQLFALEALTANSYLTSIAGQQWRSVEQSLLKVASIGLSLNPAQKHAYLIPRDGKVCLDISYRGLVELATRNGCIQHAKAHLVYASEMKDFMWHSEYELPTHNVNPFLDKAQKGELMGAYCAAKLPNGNWLVEAMSAEEIYKVRNTSQSWQSFLDPNKAAKQSIWDENTGWFEEMVKKTLIKRASKTWPSPPAGLSEAIHYLNKNGEGLAAPIVSSERNRNVSLHPRRRDALKKLAERGYQLAVERGGAFQAAKEWLEGEVSDASERKFLLREFEQKLNSEATVSAQQGG